MDKVVIRKSSLFGRYYTFLMDDLPPDFYGDAWRNLNLCTFVRRLVLRSLTLCFFVTVLAAAAGLVLFGVAGMAYLPYWLITQGWTSPLKESLAYHFWGVGIGGWILALIVGGIFGVNGLLKWNDGRLPKPEEQPSILRAWLRARKERVCPMIEVQD